MAPDGPDAVARYAEHDDGLLDVHLPGDFEHAPVLFLIHGGFWKQAWDRTHTRPLARALTEAGWVVATPEYRRVGGEGSWPTTAYDVRAAFAHLPATLAALGVTPARTVVAGHSAGGHLALWLAAEAPAAIDLVVPLAPVADLSEADRLDLGDGAVAALFGADPSSNRTSNRSSNLDQADPMVRLTELDGTPPIHVLHGIHDDTVPVSLSRRLVERHPWVRSTELPVGHFEFLETGGATYDVLLAALGAG